MIFIRYPEHSKGYVMLGEHPNGGMMEVDSRNIDFLEDEFPSIGEIKQDLQLYELQLDTELSLGEGENVIPQQVTENRTHVLQEMLRICMYQRVNLNVRFILYLLIMIIMLVHVLRIVGVVL